MHNPLRTSSGTHENRVACLVEVVTSDGVVGWGENVAPEGGFYTAETAGASYEAMARLLAPRVGAVTEMSTSDFSDEWWGVDGWPMAKHALESALWDAQCRTLGVSLATALGGTVRNVRVGVVVGVGESVAATLAEVQRRVDEGYTRVKVKIAPGSEVGVVSAVRQLLDRAIDLHVDANGAYTDRDIPMLAAMCDVGVSLIEQPFAHDDLESHARLASLTGALVCLDESVGTREDLERSIEVGACGSLNVKPSRVGGFRSALEMLELCASAAIPAWVGGMLESGIGRAGALALATHPACTLTPDLSASARYFAADVTDPFVLTDGCLRVPEGPGLGVEPLADVVGSPATKFETLFER